MVQLTKKQIFDIEFKYNNFPDFDKSIYSKSKSIPYYTNDYFWFNLSLTYNLESDVFTDFKDLINWTIVSRERYLTENFIRKHKESVKWMLISSYQRLSEKFIEEFSDKVVWIKISRWQRLSEEFIRRHIKKLNWNELLNNDYLSLSPEFICELREKYLI